MNLSDLWETIRGAVGQITGKPAAPKAAAPAPVPAPLPAPAPAPPRPMPVAAAPAPAPSPAAASPVTSATLVRPVRAGGHLLAAGTVVKVVTTHGKGTAYTVQVPGLATPKTIEGAALRIA